ncbi:MAG: hypothetical protein P1P80_06635 [ANME-2 cluster archaeon]|nr:hypothetical protein [ANME-2 cluster archaeon]
MYTVELVIRLIIGFFFVYACIYAIQSTKLAYWKQCWYVILLGSVIHMAYIFATFAQIPYAGVFRNLGMGIVALGIIMLARRTKNILG